MTLEYDYTAADLSQLAASDSDAFVRWEALQRLGVEAVLGAYGDHAALGGFQRLGFDQTTLRNGFCATIACSALSPENYFAVDLGIFEPFGLPKWLEHAIRPSASFVEAVRRIVEDRETDLSLLAYGLILPTEATLMQVAKPPMDPTRLHAARNRVREAAAYAKVRERRVPLS